MSLTAIIDYGVCNLDSVARAVAECGGRALVTAGEADIVKADHVILPGVGSYSDAMRNIRGRDIDRVLSERVFSEQIPFLGICLGMQLLSSYGFEGGKTAGLGVVPGEVIKLEPRAREERIPHVGWNEVHHDGQCPLFDGIPPGKDFYFVHSYHLRCADPSDVVAQTPYCGGFTSAIGRNQTFAVQFHPEKSQKVGFQLLRNFLKM